MVANEYIYPGEDVSVASRDALSVQIDDPEDFALARILFDRNIDPSRDVYQRAFEKWFDVGEIKALRHTIPVAIMGIGDGRTALSMWDSVRGRRVKIVRVSGPGCMIGAFDGVTVPLKVEDLQDSQPAAEDGPPVGFFYVPRV